MKTEVDSSQKKLPYPIIITQALTKRTEKVRTGKEGLEKGFNHTLVGKSGQREIAVSYTHLRAHETLR